MAQTEPAKKEQYRVVINAEKQYSIWPTWKENAPGWQDEGKSGSKEECLDHIEKTWTDMRPLSLQKFMAQYDQLPKKKIEIPKVDPNGIDYFHMAQPPNDLVKRLMKEQPVEIIRYKDKDKPLVERLKKAAELGYILVKFTETKGGTELGANIKNEDPQCYAHFDETKVVIKGRLKLDYTPVRLNATVDLATFKGTGYLEVIDDWKAKAKK